MPGENNQSVSNPDFLMKLVKTRMPFGKYKDRLLTDLPESYLVWFQRQGFPKGTLGQQLETLYEIRLNGLEEILTPIKKIVFTGKTPSYSSLLKVKNAFTPVNKNKQE